MFKVLAIVGLIATGAMSSAIIQTPSLVKKELGSQQIMGVINPAYRCGGVGTPLELRISECEGKCQMNPGQIYNCEKDFMPSSAAPSLTLKIEICLDIGFCTIILETILPNSSVQPGFIYTARYSIVPNDILSGQTVEFRGYLMHTDNLLLEICVTADIDILRIGR